MVGRWVASTPDSVAVRAEDDFLSYGELGRRADALAVRLRTAGITAESLVAIAIPRSIDYVVAALGVLRAGAGYVPLDINYPPDRLRFMITDSGARAAVVADGRGGDALPAGHPAVNGMPVVDLRADETRSASRPSSGLPTPVAADGIAYLIYTSGSSGTPKGVAVTHANVLSLLGSDERLIVAPGDRIAQLAPVSFDASTYEIWGALCAGGEIVIMPDQPLTSAKLAVALRESAPTRLFLTTGLFHVLLDQDADALAAVGTLITGGDVLSPAKVARAARLTRTMAAYGPTETTVFASLHAAGTDADPTVPIGTPLANATMRIVDDDVATVPPGTLGEIAISGRGVARGYHGRPALTAERFRPDPEATEPGARMYLSGDLGVQRPDGAFDFHGRRDRQVKVRGFRIELGEIESVLSSHPECGSAAAVTIAVEGAEKRLVAYATVVESATTGPAELRTWLAERLPPYAMPAKIVQLTEMPLDANGKTDRRRLPNPWVNRATLLLDDPYVVPDDPLEAEVAQIWAEVLDIDVVGATDDYFQLGGDSLRSVTLLARLTRIGVELSAHDLFGHATVRLCVDLVRRRGGPAARSPRPGED
jgi:amino acid adenylation domain-containing protein